MSPAAKCLIRKVWYADGVMRFVEGWRTVSRDKEFGASNAPACAHKSGEDGNEHSMDVTLRVKPRSLDRTHQISLEKYAEAGIKPGLMVGLSD